MDRMEKYWCTRNLQGGYDRFNGISNLCTIWTKGDSSFFSSGAIVLGSGSKCEAQIREKIQSLTALHEKISNEHYFASRISRAH